MFKRVGWPYQHDTLRQFVLVERDDIVKLLAGSEFDTAAALPSAVLTAYQSIVLFVDDGDRVFVHGVWRVWDFRGPDCQTDEM